MIQATTAAEIHSPRIMLATIAMLTNSSTLVVSRNSPHTAPQTIGKPVRHSEPTDSPITTASGAWRTYCAATAAANSAAAPRTVASLLRLTSAITPAVVNRPIIVVERLGVNRAIQRYVTASYIANQRLHDKRTSTFDRPGQPCTGARNLENVGIYRCIIPPRQGDCGLPRTPLPHFLKILIPSCRRAYVRWKSRQEMRHER